MKKHNKSRLNSITIEMVVYFVKVYTINFIIILIIVLLPFNLIE